jgi:hypothetical protein
MTRRCVLEFSFSLLGLTFSWPRTRRSYFPDLTTFPEATTIASRKTRAHEFSARLVQPKPGPFDVLAPTGLLRRWLAAAKRSAGSETACGSSGTPDRTSRGILLSILQRFAPSNPQSRAKSLLFRIVFLAPFSSLFLSGEFAPVGRQACTGTVSMDALWGERNASVGGEFLPSRPKHTWRRAKRGCL